MRIGSTVLLTEHGCVQSYGWNQFRPLGNVRYVIESLDEYEVDEIALIVPSRKLKLIHSPSLQQQLKAICSESPVSLGGGLREPSDLDMIHELPIERLIFNSAFLTHSYEVVERAHAMMGRQAVQALLPFRLVNDNLEIFSSSKDEFVGSSTLDWSVINEMANEVILYDTKSEGIKNAFNLCVFDHVPLPTSKIVVTGGVGPDTVEHSKKMGVASVLLDNWTLHKENSINELR